jgi:ATP-dependent RNA helicase RhlB
VLYHCSTRQKLALLLGLLQKEGGSRILIFVNRRTTAAELVRALSANGFPTRALAGNVPQEKRLKILRDFKEGRLAVLVATDVASRGLHIEGVSHVVNYDLPQDAEDYVHRIGRTGRAGAVGTAVSIACEDYVFSLDSIQKLIGRDIPVTWAPEEILAVGRNFVETRPHRRAPAPARRPAARPAAAAPVTYGREKRKSRRR